MSRDEPPTRASAGPSEPLRDRESSLVDRILERFPTRASVSTIGIGDDCAQLAQAYDLVTTDAMCEGVHFDLGFASYADVAFRCLSANLSDVAAMGAEPGPFVLSLALPAKDMATRHLDALADGLQDCLAAHAPCAAWLVGGDIVRSSAGLMLSLTLLGRAPARGPLRRDRARPGDQLLVFRELGAAAAGLHLLQQGQAEAAPALARAHLRPRVDVALGAALGLSGLVDAAMDLSDGLLQDLPRLARASDCGIDVDVDALPYPPVLDTLAEPFATLRATLDDERGLWPRILAATGGEDYGLVVACAPERVPAVRELARQHGSGCWPIGSVCPGRAVRFLSRGRELRLHPQFVHFAPSDPSGRDDRR